MENSPETIQDENIDATNKSMILQKLELYRSILEFEH